MSARTFAHRVVVKPFICLQCGSLQIQADDALAPANCDNPNCQADDVTAAGPMQKVEIYLGDAGNRIRCAEAQSYMARARRPLP